MKPAMRAVACAVANALAAAGAGVAAVRCGGLAGAVAEDGVGEDAGHAHDDRHAHDPLDFPNHPPV